MRLINPGVGEQSDRLTILSLKLLFGLQAGKDVSHFANERAALLTQIRSRTLNGKWFDAYTDLAAVNAALWHAEDDLRDFRGRYDLYLKDRARLPFTTGDMEDVFQLAFRVQALNDQRAALIERINKDAGDTVGGPEKAHATVEEDPRD